jgi:glutamate-ammonia-ligase adenylyltransferase
MDLDPHLTPTPATFDRLEQQLHSWCARHPIDSGRLGGVLPALVASAARTPQPEPTLQSALDLFERMAEWPRYLASLSQDPGAVSRLVGLIGASPWLAQLLTARPALADELLPGRYAERLPDARALRASLHDTLRRCSDDETTQWIALRNFKHSCLLHILSLDLAGALTLDQVSGALSDLAEALLAIVLQQVSRRAGHGDAAIGIVAYGKLGSREMSYASDTDIVFLHGGDPGTDATAQVRLATTVNRWLTAPTAAGTLYETDFRLRPYGDSGQLVNSLPGFRDYQLNAAWTWEHQALTRARFIAGTDALATGFTQLRREALGRVRDPEKLRADVLGMRARILASRPPGTDLATDFDVKHSRGGVIDLEFIVQFLLLRRAHQHPSLTEVGDNAGALAHASALGLIPAGLARENTSAYSAYRRWMHRERLRGNEIVRVPLQEAKFHQAAVKELWAHVFAETTESSTSAKSSESAKSETTHA